MIVLMEIQPPGAVAPPEVGRKPVDGVIVVLPESPPVLSPRAARALLRLFRAAERKRGVPALFSTGASSTAA